MSKTGKAAFVVASRRPARRRLLVVALASAFPLAAGAQNAQLQRVEITGSSIKRIDAETALPVQIITRDDIQKSGATNVEQLMQTVAAISSSGGNVVSASSGATTGSISSISLHGLTSLRTLVLLNGRRIAPYGIGFTGDSVSVDVNSIPLSAIERVEILKDGASAIYGSDAIAGVVNFILRQEFKGLELTGEYGDTTHGGADFKRASGIFGIGNLETDRFNVMVTASYQKEGALVRPRPQLRQFRHQLGQRHELGQHLPGQRGGARRLLRQRQSFGRRRLRVALLDPRPELSEHRLPLRPGAARDADSRGRAHQHLRLRQVRDHA